MFFFITFPRLKTELLSIRRLFYASFDGVDIEAEIKKLILFHCSSSTKLDRIRGPICGGVSVTLNT
jgi:hypothetical protein